MKKVLICVFLSLLAANALASDTKKRGHSKATVAARPLNDHERALHVLDRFTFGARPGEAERVLAMGVDKWFEEQLQPASIPNATLEAKLNQFRTLKMQPKELVEAFPPNNLIQKVAQGKQPMPADPIEGGLYEVLIDRYNEQKNANNTATPPDDAAKKAAEQKAQDDAQHVAQMLLSMPKDKRLPMLMQMPVGDRRTLVTSLKGDWRDKLFADFSPADREVVQAMNGPGGVVTSELQQSKVLRAIYSERQLEEVMTDFWFNHFNVFLNKDADQYLTTSYERDVIRPHALGKFRDLLVATAQSPAMLFYLDNWQSIGPDSLAANGGKPPKPGSQPQQQKGLNENYARELMELHTLSVDGGYTQHDVTEVARVFTGWTIQQPELGGGFLFDPKKHDPGDKTILGTTIKEGGENEGLQVLDMLSRSPKTARFIALKLARRFVADDPPEALVARMAQTFQESDGDIREVLRTMFHSKEFWSPAVYRAKVKTPLEFVASTIRATGTEVNNAQPLVQAVARMGMPLYQMQPPTGYSMMASTWMNSDALLDRLNFALTLSNGKVGGTKFDASRVLALGVLTSGPKRAVAKPISTGSSGLQRAVSLVEDALVGGDVSEQTEAALERQLNDPAISDHILDDPGKPLAMSVALILGSPEFQRR
ncbi:MAG TPA: DUF1800 domain-containing protein [Terriglobales bacterium]